MLRSAQHDRYGDSHACSWAEDPCGAWSDNGKSGRRDGEDGAAISPGEIVLYAREGRLVAHRVVGKIDRQDGALLLTRGDRLKTTDPPVRPDELLGRVTHVLRGNHRIDPRLTFWRKVGGLILSRSEFCARLLLWLRNCATLVVGQFEVEAASCRHKWLGKPAATPQTDPLPNSRMASVLVRLIVYCA